MNQPYEMSVAAVKDLREITRYSAHMWGTEQARKY